MKYKENSKIMAHQFLLSLFVFFILSCGKTSNEHSTVLKEDQLEEVFAYGFRLNDYIVQRDTVRYGDSFGEILEKNRVGYPKIHHIVNGVKSTFDLRRIRAGDPYMVLSCTDSLQTPKYLIYQPDIRNYLVIDLENPNEAFSMKKPMTYVEKSVSGVVQSSIYETLQDKGLSTLLAYKMADEIYAWTIDFRKIHKGDRFKVIYTDKYIDDTIYAGVDRIKAVLFEHNGRPFYAFEFKTDKGIIDYFDEEAKNLRRAFLKAPVQFSRVSSRYNLNRKIAYYGYRRPHRGTDFAAPVGTPIMATADGKVVKSAYAKGNGNYVKIRHNKTYSTQYLHMKKRKVKVGQYVKQGETIGWVGMTGNTSGPHVCYRFWKNGRQVDPFKQKLPEAKPISKSLKERFLIHMQPLKEQLDAIPFEEEETLLEEQIISLVQ